MVGDQADMLGRLRNALPTRWFPDVAPVLDGVLSGLAQTSAASYVLVSYARQQARISTATDIWLDLIARDCFGQRLQRRGGETDGRFRSRVQRELLRPRATRAALIAQVQDLTGRPPAVFEPSRPADTGVWGGYAGYGVAGGWGTLSLAFQFFIVVIRPRGGGVPLLPGYGSSAASYGRSAYASLDMLTGVTDADICTTVAAVIPAASIAWTRITA